MADKYDRMADKCRDFSMDNSGYDTLRGSREKYTILRWILAHSQQGWEHLGRGDHGTNNGSSTFFSRETANIPDVMCPFGVSLDEWMGMDTKAD